MLSRRLKLGVIGASGFIGTALVKNIVQSPWADILLFGRQEGWVEGVAVSRFIVTAESLAGLDVVIHLSGITSSRGSEEELRRANVDLAVETARAAAAAGVKRFIFLSSLHVHGKTANRPIGPQTPIGPHNAYGASKALAETELKRIAKETGIELVILRPPMVYGPNCKGSFAQLARLVRTGLPMPFLHANGKRSFCSVSNLVSAIRYTSETQVPPAVLLPADPEDFDTSGLVREMAQAMGRRVRLLPIPKTLLAAPMTLVGQGDMITSLFEPLQIDRTHWDEMTWRPSQSATNAVEAALAQDARSVLYITNSTPYFFSHRIALAHEASRRGFKIALAGSDVDAYEEQLNAASIEPLKISELARGINPAGDLRAALSLAAQIRRRRPTVVHASGLKTIFLTALAGLRSPLPRTVCLITGLGATYINDTALTRTLRFGIETVIRPLLRGKNTIVIFQNGDDRDYFLKRGLTRDNNSHLIKGSGVDTNEYAWAPETETTAPLVIFPARLLKSKGAREFAQAAAILKSDGILARFAFVGDLDPVNPDALSREELVDLSAKGQVEIWGFQNDMASVLAQCHLVCLPSYREGLPKALIEAASAGRAIVTTDAPGCREIVTDGVNGRIVPVRDATALANALRELILDQDKRRMMGAAGRKLVEEQMSNEVVIRATADLYGSLASSH